MTLDAWLTLEDVLAAARASAAAPDLDMTARRIVARAALGRAWRRAHRASHPRYGDGSLTRAAAGLGLSPWEAPLPHLLRCVSSFCLALSATDASRLAGGGVSRACSKTRGQGAETLSPPPFSTTPDPG